jgi:predicted nucleotidyltransferase
MRRAETTAVLAAHAAPLRAMGVGALFMFGSTARDEAGPGSDIDLFFDPARPGLSLFDVMDVRDQVASLLDRPVDVMTRASLHPYLRPRIEAEAIRIF